MEQLDRANRVHPDGAAPSAGFKRANGVVDKIIHARTVRFLRRGSSKVIAEWIRLVTLSVDRGQEPLKCGALLPFRAPIFSYGDMKKRGGGRRKRTVGAAKYVAPEFVKRKRPHTIHRQSLLGTL